MSSDVPPPKLVLPSEAYRALAPGEVYSPVIPGTTQLPEVTVRALVVGVLVAVIFGAANAYLGLKVGLTVSASIPAAVAGVAVFRAMRYSGNPLETNIVQTIGSSGEALAAGAIFTLPVLYLWGETPGFWPIFPLSLLGGLLGLLFMIPLRRLLIVQEHGRLPYPEGTACAEVIIAAQSNSRLARLLFTGMGVGGLYAALQKFGQLWPSQPDIGLNTGSFRTSIGADVTPELLGVGYIIGPRVAAVLLAGGAMGWLVLIPLVYLFGGAATGPVPPEVIVRVAEMDSFTVWGRYIRYIGAGAVAFAGLFSLLHSAPTLWASIRIPLIALHHEQTELQNRLNQDLPLGLIVATLLGIGLLVAFIPLRTGGSLGLLAALAVVVFSFFFVTVSSRIVGLIGSSSNPISGMTISTVLICALLFGGAYPAGEAKIAVLTIGSLVCIAAALAGDTSQDLKTGFLLGATPQNQQIAQVISVVAVALVMSTVLALFQADIVSGVFIAPQANLIRLVIEGVLEGNLPWGLVLVGVALAACVQLMGLSALAFAVGLYLPIHLSVPIAIGGLIRLGSEFNPEGLEHRQQRGILYASGLIAGGALVGVAAGLTAFFNLAFLQTEPPDSAEWLGAAIAFALLSATLAWIAIGVPNRQN